VLGELESLAEGKTIVDEIVVSEHGAFGFARRPLHTKFRV